MRGASTSWFCIAALVLASAGCARGWTVDIIVDRGALAIPDRIELEILEWESLDGLRVSFPTTISVSGSELFAVEGESNRVEVNVSNEAGAVRVRAMAFDAGSVMLGSGAVRVERESGDPTVDMLFYEPGSLEIGIRSMDGTFAVMQPGQLVPVVLGGNGLNMIVPCLRTADDVDPHTPDPTVEVRVGGYLAAADLEGERLDMVDDGTGYVLWDLNVAFQHQLCCFNCSEGLVTARIWDIRGKMFVAEGVTVTVARAACPDPEQCCHSADQCVDPALATNLCE